MWGRQNGITSSILNAIFNDPRDNKTFLARVRAFFTFFRLWLFRLNHELFKSLRARVWEMDEDEYRESFRRTDKKGSLKAVGDLGYSGSTFFTTPNSKFLIKSLPRRFEYSFFQDDLLQPYYDYMRGHRSSLLVRITDFLWTPYTSLGGLLGFAPTHHIVMENIMYGKDLDTQGDKWETYDLKPTSFFYPERDILEGALTSQATKDKLVDDFDDKIRITEAQFNDLLSVLEADTAFLEKHNAVDYSLFLVRFPASANIEYLDQKKTIWGEGIESTDKQWKYRVVLLDFFWAKHKLQAKAMTGLINSYNVIGRHGPMSITTTPKDYRDRFLKMVRGFIEVIEPSR